MADSSPIFTNFTSGELSPRLNGRIDMDKYYNGASTISNFVVLMHGGLTKRPGTRFIREIKTSSGSNSGARLVPFVFSKTQAYVLEFGHNYIRFYKDEGIIVSSGTTPYEIATTYTAAQLDELEFVQSADILYIVHGSHEPAKLSRTGHTAWTLTDVDFKDGPYTAVNGTSTTFSSSATTGSVTITASSSVFTANDVGRWIRMKAPDKWGAAEITGYTSGTQVTASVHADFPIENASTTTKDWRLGAFYIGNYPTKATFYEERLIYANTDSHPNTVWGSVSGDFDTFSPSGADATIADSDGLNFTLSSDQVNQITGMYGGKYLNLFTKNGTFNMSSGSATQGLSPTTVQVINETNDGAADKKVIPASKSTLYIGKNKKRLREFAYNIGKAFQIQDDLLEIYSDTKSMGKSLGSDVLSKKQTALTIMARKIAPNEWSDIYHNIESYPIEKMLNIIRSFFDRHNIYSETKTLTEKYINNAFDNLLVIPESSREYLISFTNFIRNREY